MLTVNEWLQWPKSQAATTMEIKVICYSTYCIVAFSVSVCVDIAPTEYSRLVLTVGNSIYDGPESIVVGE